MSLCLIRWMVRTTPRSGNPLLKCARIDNLDLRWEWLPSQDEQVLLGVFYKYLKDPIETTFDVDQRQGNASYYMPQNLGNARNYGIELDVVKYIRHFGLKPTILIRIRPSPRPRNVILQRIKWRMLSKRGHLSIRHHIPLIYLCFIKIRNMDGMDNWQPLILEHNLYWYLPIMILTSGRSTSFRLT